MGGNEPVDQLTRLAAETLCTGPEPHCSLGKSYFRQELKKMLDYKQATCWQKLPGHGQVRELVGALTKAIMRFSSD